MTFLAILQLRISATPVAGIRADASCWLFEVDNAEMVHEDEVVPKSLLYGLAASANITVALLLYLYADRLVIPLVLSLGAFCFAIAAIGEARRRL